MTLKTRPLITINLVCMTLRTRAFRVVKIGVWAILGAKSGEIVKLEKIFSS